MIISKVILHKGGNEGKLIDVNDCLYKLKTKRKITMDNYEMNR